MPAHLLKREGEGGSRWGRECDPTVERKFCVCTHTLWSWSLALHSPAKTGGSTPPPPVELAFTEWELTFTEWKTTARDFSTTTF